MCWRIDLSVSMRGSSQLRVVSCQLSCPERRGSTVLCKYRVPSTAARKRSAPPLRMTPIGAWVLIKLVPVANAADKN